jgi:hypothetical protein
MRRKIAITVAVAAALGLLIAGVSFASDGPSNSAQPRVLNVISRATAINNFVDTGPSGVSPGDLYVFTERLFLATAPSEQIGIADGRCVLVDPAAFRFDCSTTSKFPEGDIMTAGTFTLIEGTTSVGAIIGGTDAYREARGEASLTLGPFEGPHEVTYRLVLTP